MLFHLLISAFLGLTLGQRYAERNKLLPDAWPVEDVAYEDYDMTEGYGFDEERDIYRWNVNDYPHPRENPRFCNRLKSSNVCDPDNVLEKEQADKLDFIIQKLYKETPCICDSCGPGDGGIVVGIALLKNMFQPYNEHPARIIRSFAEQLRSKWKLGKCDNDILIVVATTDRLSYTDVGRATSSHLSLEEAHRIFLENKAHFTAGHFFEGLQAMVADYHKWTRDMKRPVEEELNIGLISGVIVGVIVGLGIIMFLAFVIYRRCRSKKDPEKQDGSAGGKSEGVSSSWTKQDIKVMFGSMKASDKPGYKSVAKYQPCKSSDEKDNADKEYRDEEEVIDTTLAIPEVGDGHQTSTGTTTSTEAPGSLERELTDAAEGIARTFTSFQPKREYKGHVTDL